MNGIPDEVQFFSVIIIEELIEMQDSLKSNIIRLTVGAPNFANDYARMQAEIDLLVVLEDRIRLLGEELFLNQPAQ